jgi:hypothetical protein
VRRFIAAFVFQPGARSKTKAAINRRTPKEKQIQLEPAVETSIELG